MTLPPGPSTPGAVQAMQWMYRPIPFMERCREKYGPIFSIRLGAATGIVVVADPKFAMDVLSGDPKIYESGQANLLFRPVLGKHSLLTLDGDEHRTHRKILLPHFKAGHVQVYAGLIERAARKHVSAWPRDGEMALAPEMQAITYEAISSVTFGEAQDERLQRLAELMGEMMDRAASPFTMLPPLRMELGGLSPYARLMKLVGEIDELVYSIIEDRRNDPLSQLREDVLSALLKAEHEDGSPLSDREIRDEVLTTIMAGFETTTQALTWGFERLARSPAIRAKLIEAVKSDDESYLDAVVKEVLRARPAVPIVARKVRMPVTVGDHRVPAGTVLMVNVYLVHRDPGVYPEPDEFRPERFLGGLPDPRAWIPFGGGVRRCLGVNLAQLEMRTVLRTAFEELDFEPVDAEDEETVRRRFTFAPKDSGLVRIRTRKPAPAPAPERLPTGSASTATD
jgi:cytochrome P450 family 135